MEKNKLENIEGIENLIDRNIIERNIIEIAIKEELKENRKVIIAPIKEHYDILSIGKNPNDIRYIEVKGHISILNSIFIYLKRKEFDFAKEMKDKYWIYLINMIKDEEIKIFKIRDPINKLKWEEIINVEGKKRKKIYLSNIHELLKNNINNPDLKIVSLKDLKNILLEKSIITEDKVRKITIPPIKKAREIKIEDLKALNNINNISKEEKDRLKELGLIRYIEGKVMLTSSGIKLLKLIRNKKLKEEELYELLKKEQGKIPFSLLKK